MSKFDGAPIELYEHAILVDVQNAKRLCDYLIAQHWYFRVQWNSPMGKCVFMFSSEIKLDLDVPQSIQFDHFM